MIYPAHYDITIEQRANFDRVFSFSSDGEPLDLTDYTIEASIWTEQRRKLCDFVFTWVDQTAGQFSLTLTPAVTTKLVGVAVWDMLVTDPAGDLDYWLRGAVRIEPGFTV